MDDNNTPKGPVDLSTTTAAGRASTENISDSESSARGFSPVEFGEKLFQWRDFTPIPIILILLFIAKPNAASATLGTLMIVFGELIRIYSVAFIGSISRTRSSNTGNNLIKDGPFSYVRNPLYVGNFFITTGVAIFGGQIWFVILTIAAFSFQYYCIVKYEETLLQAKFGDDFQQYMDSVPAWIPRKVPDIDTMEWPDTFSPALRSERRTLTAIITIVAVLLILSPNRTV